MKLTINSYAKLNNNTKIPFLGLGVYQSPAGAITRNSVLYALAAGYRHIDTAKIYGNEKSVGEALRESDIPRSEIFVTTKLWNSDHGYDSTLKACDESLNNLGLDYIDLYLIQWPVVNVRLKTWKAMEKLLHDGKCRAIGVSNYMLNHLKELLDNANVPPAINQIELTPYNYHHRKTVVDFCQKNNIRIEAYSPLTKGRKLNDPALLQIAGNYGKTPAQLLIRWSLEQKFVVIPKSIHQERIEENAHVFDFSISPEDITALNSLDEKLVTGWNPEGKP